MKKVLFVIVAFLLVSCSDRYSETSGNNNNPSITIENLKNATLTPVNSSVTGFEQKIEYVLKKGDKTLLNTDYEWFVSDTLHGRTNIYGHFYSRTIGETNVNVKDNNGNSLVANVKANPKVTDIPNVPYIKWGATNSQIKNNIDADWILATDQYPYLNPTFKKGNIGVRYYISASTGLFRVEITENYNQISGWSGGFTNVNKLTDYNNERFIKLSINAPNYYGYNKWWFVNPIDNGKVYTNITSSSNPVHYMLSYSAN